MPALLSLWDKMEDVSGFVNALATSKEVTFERKEH